MARPISIGRPILSPAVMLPLFSGNTFDSSDEDKELWQLEQEICHDLERIENKHQDLFPIGKTGTEVKQINYVDEEEEEEEEDDNDDVESDSSEPDDDDEEEVDMEIEEIESPSF